MPGSTVFSPTLVELFMQNYNNKNIESNNVKEAGPVGTAEPANEGATAMPSSSNAKESAMTMSGTSNNNEVGGVHVSTARGSTENASSRKQIPERVAEEVSGSISMTTETSSNSLESM